MQSSQDILTRALSERIINKKQFQSLAAMFAAGAAMPALQANGLLAELDAPADDTPPTPAEASEAPRFVRGFHDVLITIGVIAALSGLWGLATAWFVIPGVIVLAEVLVMRQRLALPAFALTLIYSIAMVAIAIPFAGQLTDGSESPLSALVLFLAQPIALVPFYWRYRVPVALAFIIVSLFGMAFSVALIGLQAAMGIENLFTQGPLIAALAGLVFALGLFGVAMAFDLRDPKRITRRSDVAFWLHLATAPALLYAIFAVIFYDGSSRLWWSGDPGLREALLAVAVVAVLMLAGIVIDRRAFVTSGLVSLGAAIAILAREAQIDVNDFAALPVFAVGLVVLILGIGWQKLRGMILRLLPAAIASRVPPAV